MDRLYSSQKKIAGFQGQKLKFTEIKDVFRDQRYCARSGRKVLHGGNDSNNKFDMMIPLHKMISIARNKS